MALVVNIKCVENLKGKADRFAKLSFRGEEVIDIGVIIIVFNLFSFYIYLLMIFLFIYLLIYLLMH